MANLNHVGRIKSNQRKCAVVFRTIPGDPNSCLILPTENLSPEDHDAVINLLESNAGQTAQEFGQAMDRALLNDGSRMLPRFHASQKLVKMKTSEIEMVPNTQTSVSLDELNRLIAEQKGISIEDLAMSEQAPRQRDLGEPSVAEQPEKVEQPVSEAQPSTDGVLTDEDLAAQYRSQADALFKEAKKLREQAEELVPTKRKTKSSA